MLSALALKNYQGGSNPLLVVILFGLIFFTVLLGVVFACHRAYKVLRFNKICSDSKMTGEEIGFLKNFLRRLHVQNPLDVVTRKNLFDEFMNRVGRYYANLGLSEEDLVQEEQIFHTMRDKLGLKHNFKIRKLKTSRALPKGYPVNIICADRETQNIFTFQSKIINNNEFFLGLAPPDRQISKEIFKQKKTGLEVAFDRERGVQYMFDSHLVRTVDFPETMWYIAHSKELIQGEKQRSLTIPATIMLTNPDEHGRIDEFSVNIHSLTNKGCAFSPEKKRHPFENTPKVLISFEVENRSYTCRGQIINLIKTKDAFQYRLNFVNLTPEEEQDLLRFILHQREIQKKQAKKSKTSKTKEPEEAVLATAPSEGQPE